MTNASDQLIKQEIFEIFEKMNKSKFDLRIFINSSTQDQRDFFKDKGLTFRDDNFTYGSCDACLYRNIKKKEIIAIEGSDCLNRRSSGSAQYQRFHHILGPVRLGLIGIYYLRKGEHKIREDLYEMAYQASMSEKGIYIVTNDLTEVMDIINSYDDQEKRKYLINQTLINMKKKSDKAFNDKYNNDFNIFAEKRSSVILEDKIIKYQGNNYSNFTKGELRGGHLALGEIYLGKYIYPDIVNNNKKLFFLFPRLTKSDLLELDEKKRNDKEWNLIRGEQNVFIKTMDDLQGIGNKLLSDLKEIKNESLKNGTKTRRIYNECMKQIVSGLKNGKIKLI